MIKERQPPVLILDKPSRINSLIQIYVCITCRNDTVLSLSLKVNLLIVHLFIWFLLQSILSQSV